MDIILTPVRVATSKPARQTYLNTILFLTTSTILLGLAVVAYVLFYFNYVPQIGIERVVHLQYGDGLHPYGIAALDSSIVSQQAYDIHVSLSLPRSPPNLAAGNFMLSLSLLSPTYSPPPPSSHPPNHLRPGPSSSITLADILLHSRRPAILTYTSRLVSLSERLATLPLYILGLRHESETLTIAMAESARFAKGWKNVPAYLLLELQATTGGGQAVQVQVYDVRVRFTARFGGLRWLMYNHRVTAFVVFTTAFWLCEVLFAVVGWVALRAVLAGAGEKGEGKRVKDEQAGKSEETDGSSAAVRVKWEEETDDPDLSDTERTFPTYGRQAPLRYVPARVKQEGNESDEKILDETGIQPLAGEADDEEEYPKVGTGRSDSGIGTSFSEGVGSRGSARRRSRGGR